MTGPAIAGRTATMLISRSTLRVRPGRRGFTLIELMAVIAIILILMTFLLPRITAAIGQAKVTACRANLLEIYKGLQIYHMKHQRLPEGSGVQFFAALIADGVWENTKENAKRLSCPEVERGALAIGQIDDPEEWYKDLQVVDGGYSAYAGREMKQHGLRRFPGSGKDALVADDNDPEMNHSTTTCVLYADGTVGTFEFLDLRKKGVMTDDEEHLTVGADSPVDELRKLTLD